MVLLRKANPNASSEEGMCLCPTTGTVCLNFKPAFYTRPLVSCVFHRGHATTDWVSYTCSLCGMHLFLHREINYMVVPRSTVHTPVFTLFHVLQHPTDSLDYDCLINY